MSTPKFGVGDRVKIIGASIGDSGKRFRYTTVMYRYTGETATIREVLSSGRSYAYRLNEYSFGWEEPWLDFEYLPEELFEI